MARKITYLEDEPKKITYIEDEPTRIESALRGGAQGITFGGMPSLTAAVKAPFSEKDLGTLLEEETGKYKRAEEAHPYVSAGSEIASGIVPAAVAEYFSGGLATPAVATTGAARHLPKLAKLAKTIYSPSTAKGFVATGAAVGGLKSEGISEGDPLQILEDIAKGGALGYVGGKYIAPVAGKVMQKTGQLVERGATKLGLGTGAPLMSTLFGPSVRAIKERFTRNKAITGAKPYEDLAQDLANGAKKIRTELHVLSEKAWSELPDKPLMNVEDALGMVRQLQDQLKVSGEVVGSASEVANNKLEQYAQNLTSIGKRTPYLKSTEVKQLLKSLDDDIDWDDLSPDVLTQSLKGLRGQIDGFLKDAHPDYEAAMAPVAEHTRLLKDIKGKFALARGSGGDFAPSDTTATKIKAVNDAKKMYSRDILERYKQATGEDVIQEANDFRTASEFMRSSTQGSRKAVTYAATGAAAGGWLGGTPGAMLGSGAGALTGAHMDIMGGEYAGKTIDFLVRQNPEKLRQLIRLNPAAFGKYGPVMENALKRGVAGFAANHFIMQQKDPEYRKFIETTIDDLGRGEETKPQE
jgi:hypothetical protein